MFWHPTKPKILDWVDQKAREFAQEESSGSQLNLGEWLGRYIYSGIHEIFFSEFPIILYEWLVRLSL